MSNPGEVAVANDEAVARGTFSDWIALTKPRITVMNVLMAAGAMALAPGELAFGQQMVLLAGTALAVGAANVFNMVLERDSDGLMARTALRPLPTGKLQPRPATIFGVVMGVVAVAILAVLGPIPSIVGFLAIVLYAAVYTPLKRRTPLALLIGAVPGAAPPLIGWTAVTGTLDPGAWALFAVLLIWQIPHFLAIGIYRKDEYARAGIKTVPVVRGDDPARIQAIAWSTLLLVSSLSLVPLGVASWVYGAVAAVLGLAFLGHGIKGLRFQGPPLLGWARRYFLHSIVYLPVLTLALVLDRLVV